MADRRGDGTRGTAPVPKERADQQASDAPDPWDLPEDEERRPTGPDQEAPDVDEAGAGPRGAPRSGSVHPEQPVPDEPPG
ncbi:hypothetical protein IHE55_25985 [Streptomyces pactum]|uniref:Uncharacterized protein n=1 Tax=Streptomyces pactum TaxID=68249 RepID=A0ABS0NSB7_9ACTN|nr:hypothetical protein [Streptomyces pactum]MBH5338041.1 hypothetical protein [Streptomyces pactum]